ncbi:MAG: UDP-N-acetylglucosamine 1-carboxyvinyltransferase [Candidatus Merdivicinus sp.]|jgi:UDP-N-acetylglucosamine 1-carboxyvinyltransferase
MERLMITGGNPLRGEIRVHGAKNSSLPLLAACVLCRGETVLHNCPDLSDVTAACEILSYLGCQVRREGRSVLVNAENITRHSVPEPLMREMRSSIVFLGAIAARTGFADLSFPGGCELGPRPIDLHLAGLRKLGLKVEEEGGNLLCRTEGRLAGTNIALSFPSVGATENILLAAVTAKGRTVLTNAAREPEIIDLADFLNKCGAKIRGAGEGTIIVDGVASLHGCEHRVIPDRIVAATFLSCAACTGGDILVQEVEPVHLAGILPIFEEMGCSVSVEGKNVRLCAPVRLHAARDIRTMPYPGFPTDAQAPLMAVATLAEGTTMFVENIFESRYKHASQLARMGAKIKLEGRVAVVEGVPMLHGANVECTDLRGGAALVAAGLAAEGETILREIHHIDRGYEQIEEVLTPLGANMKRIAE